MRESSKVLHTQVSSKVAIYKALMLSMVILLLFGLLAVYSSSYLKGMEIYNSPFHFLNKQALAIVLGTIIVTFILWMPFSWIENGTRPIFVLTLFVLLLVFVPGLYAKVGGAARWLKLGGFRFQPSEIAKLATVLFLAKTLSSKSFDLNNFRQSLLPLFGALSLLVICLMRQPDFGTTLIILGITFLMFFAAGMKKKYIALGFLTGVLGFAGAIFLAPYRMKRVFSFLDPWGQFKEGGFQIIQSYVAFNNGGLLGSGLGNSHQKLYFLPEAHTDFILSVIAEELGLLGIILISSVFMFLIYLGFKVTQQQTTHYRKFLAFGLTCFIALQSFTNFAVTMGLVPTKGLPLPFISSGSSALLVFMTAMGLLIKLAKEMPDYDRIP